MCVGRNSRIIPSGGKRQVQPLISDVAKKMRMSSNLAKRKREEEEPAHLEDDWEGGLHSNSCTVVCLSLTKCQRWIRYATSKIRGRI